MSPSRSQVIFAPSDSAAKGVRSIFLAGSTSNMDLGDWRAELSASLSDLPVTIFNPHRLDWDGSWYEDIDCKPFREQVEWEIEKQRQADIVVVFFQPATQAPISLLELGINIKSPGKAIVVCPPGYWKRGYVQIVCDRFAVEMVDTVGDLKEAVMKSLPTTD